MEDDMAIKYRYANSVLQISRYSIDDEKYQLTIYSEKKIHYFLKVKKNAKGAFVMCYTLLNYSNSAVLS